MPKIYDSGHFLTFASRTILFCLVVIVVGPICPETSAVPIVTKITPDRGQLSGDSPIWMTEQASVYFIDGSNKLLIRCQPDSGSIDSVQLDASGDLKFLVPLGNKTKFAIGYGNGVGVFMWNGKSATVISPEFYLKLSNDTGETVECGKADPFGRLWVGTSYPGNGNGRMGRLYSIDENANIVIQLNKAGVPGGMAWSTDDNWLYWADTNARTIVCNPFNQNTKVLVEYGQEVFMFASNSIAGVPNGMTIDIDGNLWVACKGFSYVVKLTPNAQTNGTKLTEVRFPGTSSVTSVVFGSSTKQDLYVTTSNAMFRVTNTGAIGIDVFGIDVKSWPRAKHPEETES